MSSVTDLYQGTSLTTVRYYHITPPIRLHHMTSKGDQVTDEIKELFRKLDQQHRRADQLMTIAVWLLRLSLIAFLVLIIFKVISR